jgi:hypothetical protein
VWTNRYNAQRTGATNETTLTQANVGPGKFGLLFTRTVDGTIQAEPLYVPGLTIKGAMHNVVFVATENDTVYAFDADDPNASAPLWQQSMGPSIPSSGASTFACGDLQPTIGITSTPVIDTSNADPTQWTLYVEAKTLEGGSYKHKLHALDVTTGMDRTGSPVEITATVAGTGDGSSGGMVAFDPQHQMDRPGLLLDHGVIYMAFASHCDSGNYHGWVMAYDAATLQQKAVFITTPNTGRGGIWQSGMGLTTDGSGSIYFVAGNSTKMLQPTPGKEFGLSAVRLTLNGSSFTVDDYWTESDFVNLNTGDNDLTSAAIIDMSTNLAFVGGKDAKIHVLDRTSMGHYTAPPGPDAIVQTVPVVVTNPIQYKSGHMHGSPVLWSGPDGMHIFVWPEQSPLQDFTVSPSTKPPLSATPVKKGMILPPHPGGMVTVSSNGTMAGTGILWAALVPDPTKDAWHSIVPGTLYAFNAEDVSKPALWTSDLNTSDNLGLFAKFCPPTVANGRVYIGTATTTNALHVYGLKP